MLIFMLFCQLLHIGYLWTVGLIVIEHLVDQSFQILAVVV